MVRDAMSLLTRGAVEIIQEEELKKKLCDTEKKGGSLTVKVGFDPTAPDIHLGHTVLLRKMRHFQDCGHTVIFLIGDFTGLVGDPSGASKTRPRLTRREVRENAKTYARQVAKICDMKRLTIAFNSRWFERMSLYGLAELAAKQTVARVLERDDFNKRYRAGQDISYLEFLYPLLQAYDSVHLKADIELGGTDQKFNMLMGRTIQERYGQRPQVVLTMPLLEGLDGVQKMSKSLGNYVGINEPPKEMFGKLMSVSDAMMIKYYELLTDANLTQITQGIQRGRLHPKQAKLNLARTIVSMYYDEKTARHQEDEFERAFKEKKFPTDVPCDTAYCASRDITVVDMLSRVSARFGGISKSELKRKVREGAVEIDGTKITDIHRTIAVSHAADPRPHTVRIGKRFARIRVCVRESGNTHSPNKKK